MPVLLLAVIFFSCSKAKTDYVRVKFTNMTGHELKGLKIGGNRIGTLSINEETAYIPYKVFYFDTGLPDEQIQAKIDHEKINDFSDFYWCGSEKYAVTEGTFEIEIRKVDYDDKVYLMLKLK